MSNTPMINTPGDDDVQLFLLQNWALSISWCSRAILDTFYDDTMLLEESRTLIINENGELVPPATLALETYEAYSDIFDFTTLSSGLTPSDQYTFVVDADTYGLGAIRIEISTNALDPLPDWFVWYDTNIVGAGEGFPNGFLDLSNVPKNAGDEDPFGNPLTSGLYLQLHFSITNDAEGYGGYINYYGIVANPNLYL